MPLQVDGHPVVEVQPGQTLLEVCEAAAIPMESACGGFAACNSCRVAVLQGADALSPLLPEEEDFLDGPGQRLGCQAHILQPEATVRVRLEPGA